MKQWEGCNIPRLYRSSKPAILSSLTVTTETEVFTLDQISPVNSPYTDPQTYLQFVEKHGLDCSRVCASVRTGTFICRGKKKIDET